MGADLFHADRRTSGRTDMTKLRVVFLHFANAPKTSGRNNAKRLRTSSSWCNRLDRQRNLIQKSWSSVITSEYWIICVAVSHSHTNSFFTDAQFRFNSISSESPVPRLSSVTSSRVTFNGISKHTSSKALLRSPSNLANQPEHFPSSHLCGIMAVPP